MHRYLSDIPLWKSVVWVFQYFCKWPKAPFSSAFRLSTTPANELKNGSCILSGSISALSEGKWTKGYKWPASLKCIYATWLWHNHKKMPVVEGTLSLPLHTSMHRHENGHLIIYILWRNDFTLGVIAQYMIYHDQCVMVSLWKFTLSLACTELTHVWKAELFPSLPFFFFFFGHKTDPTKTATVTLDERTEPEASQSSVTAETMAPISSSSAASPTVTSSVDVQLSGTWSNRKLKRDKLRYLRRNYVSWWVT